MTGCKRRGKWRGQRECAMVYMDSKFKYGYKRPGNGKGSLVSASCPAAHEQFKVEGAVDVLLGMIAEQI